MADHDTTHFGFETIPAAEKVQRVEEVFTSVADRYDLMNDLMSWGMHRIWKRLAVAAAGIRSGQSVLDLAGGTGDLAARIAPVVGDRGQVVLCDFNRQMIARGRDRLLDRGYRVGYVQADAESLPFPDRTFHCVVMAFGLRNVTVKERALASIRRVLRRGGRLVVLEFSELQLSGLRALYDRYSFDVLPKLGQWITGDAASYRYLAESIRTHPDQETLLDLFRNAGFGRCRYLNMVGGIVAVHRGYRLD